MDALSLTLLALAALAAGAINSVAGGGSFISYPALLLAGVPPVPANATNTVALWPGSLASVVAYRGAFSFPVRPLFTLGAISILGGALGALLLLVTPERTFVRLLPWLMLGATLLFAAGPQIQRMIGGPNGRHGVSAKGGRFLLVALAQFSIAVYGGYFGGGIGILMLATLALYGLDEIHEMNALKTLLGSLINGSAVIWFVASGSVAWPQALVMMAGATAGGYGGAWLAQRVAGAIVRRMVVAIGAIVTVVFFLK